MSDRLEERVKYYEEFDLYEKFPALQMLSDLKRAVTEIERLRKASALDKKILPILKEWMDSFVEAWWDNDDECLRCPCCEEMVREWNQDPDGDYVPPVHFLEKHLSHCLYRRSVEAIGALEKKKAQQQLAKQIFAMREKLGYGQCVCGHLISEHDATHPNYPCMFCSCKELEKRTQK